jgi:hypothetical protein
MIEGNRRSFLMTSGASYRQVADMRDVETHQSAMMSTMGQSGNLGSHLYDVLNEDWATGQYHRTAMVINKGQDGKPSIARPAEEWRDAHINQGAAHIDKVAVLRPK